MSHLNRFIYNLKYFINNAIATPGTEPETLTRKILIALTAEKNSPQDQQSFTQFIRDRGIQHLIHFTHINNLSSILSYGLIPRIYLEEEVIRIAMRPTLSDSQRIDGLKDANFLSMSYTNYRMFYSKSVQDRRNWAVLCLSPRILEKHACQFSPLNSASRASNRASGILGARRLFSNLKLRRQLELPPDYPTSPEAEVLEQSVVPPGWIEEVHVFDRSILEQMSSQATDAGVPIKVDHKYFKPRVDYSYWQLNSSFSVKDDYSDVLAEEMNSKLSI